jgi:hypothetical protein
MISLLGVAASITHAVVPEASGNTDSMYAQVSPSMWKWPLGQHRATGGGIDPVHVALYSKPQAFCACSCTTAAGF